MNNFRIYFKGTTRLEIGGEKYTFPVGKSVAFKNISDKDVKAIRKAAIKFDTMIFTITDDTLGVYRVIYGNKKAAAENAVKEKVKSLKGSKKDKFKGYTAKVGKETREEVKEEPTVKEVIEEDQECVKNTQNSLTEEQTDEIINISEEEAANEQVE